MIFKKRRTPIPNELRDAIQQAAKDIKAREHAIPPWRLIRILATLSLSCLTGAVIGILMPELLPRWAEISVYAVGVGFGLAALAAHQLPGLKVKHRVGTDAKG